MSHRVWQAAARLAWFCLAALALSQCPGSFEPAPAAATSLSHVYLPHIANAPSRGQLAAPVVGRIDKPWQYYDPSEAVPGQMLVKWRDGVGVESIARINAGFNVRSVGHIQGIGVQILQVAPDMTVGLMAAYNSLPEVEYAEPNFIAHAFPDAPVVSATAPDDLKPSAASVNDPNANQQYSLTKMQVYDAWDLSKGDSVVIAVLDTGADFTHPDLQGKFVSRGKDFINRDDDATDDHGHGTHVSGIAAGATNNGVGIAGVGYNAKVLPGKVLAASGSGDFGAIASGITWAADQGVKVINMSLGGRYGAASMESAINYAWSKGVVVVCAAGNDASPSPSYPAAYENCISVVATDSSDRRASFSNYGSTVDVSAPGAGILSTVRGGKYEAWSGTSMASPNAAGVAALVWAAHPDWTNAQVRAALENTADNVGSANEFGHGRLNAYRAVSSGPISTPQPGQPTTTPQPGQPTATPQPTARPTNTPVPTAPPDDYELQLIQLINQQRVAAGLPPLEIDPRLMNATDFHNRWMLDNGCFAHQCSGEPDPFARMRNAGYPLLSGSENIGQGYRTPSDMVTGWMGSSGHRANILGNWTHIGCGFLQGPSGSYTQRYWTCNFANPSGVVPTLTPTTAPTDPARTNTPGAPTSTRTPTSSTPPSQAEWARRTLAEINRIRAERGLPPAVFHPSLGQLAQTYSQYMLDNNCFSHYCYSNPWARIREAGYDAEAFSEVIAKSFDTPEGAVNGWMNSTAHRDIIMDQRDGQQLELGCGWDDQLFFATCEAGYRVVNATATPTALPALTPTATWTPLPPTATLTPTATLVPPPATLTPGPTKTGQPTLPPTSTPDLPEPLPTATIIPGEVEIVLTPPSNLVGWVGNTGLPHWGEADIYAGLYYAQLYVGGVQFPLAQVPRDATLLSAQLELMGRTTDYITGGTQAVWYARWLDQAIDGVFPGNGYQQLKSAAVKDTLSPSLSSADLARGRTNIFIFNAAQVAALNDQLRSSGRISFRLDGPDDGSTINTMAWETGYSRGSAGPDTKPVLRLSYVQGPLPQPPTATPAPPTATIIPPTATSVPPTVTPTTKSPDTPVPPTETPIPPTQTAVPPTATWTPTDTPPPTPIPSATPMPPTATWTPEPTLTPAPTATPPPLSRRADLTPASNAVGWVITLDTDSNHLGDDDIFAGKWGDWTYYGLLQFDLARLPTDAEIQGAELILYSQTREYVAGGTWSVKLLGPDVDADFPSLTFPAASHAPVLGVIGDAIPDTAIASPGRANVLTFQPGRVADLQARAASTGRISFRVDGPPPDGSTYSLADWDSGYGSGLGPDFKPILRVSFLSALSEP
ncbi:MAG: S8 family serine peptidase [Anaerolineae bacterium]|nr:S8 family serine peptidase [Anaerolineae bacterium]